MPEKNPPTLIVLNKARRPHVGAPITINGINGVKTDSHGAFSLKDYIGHKVEDLVINGYKVSLVNLSDDIKKISTHTRLIFRYTMKAGHEVGEIIDSNNIPLIHHE